jgi:hypothetical protein
MRFECLFFAAHFLTDTHPEASFYTDLRLGFGEGLKTQANIRNIFLDISCGQSCKTHQQGFATVFVPASVSPTTDPLPPIEAQGSTDVHPLVSFSWGGNWGK